MSRRSYGENKHGVLLVATYTVAIATNNELLHTSRHKPLAQEHTQAQCCSSISVAFWVKVRVGLGTQWCLSADQKYFHFSGACACAVHRTYDITTQAEAQAKEEGESCVCLRSPFTLNFSCAYAYAYAYAYACIVRVRCSRELFRRNCSAHVAHVTSILPRQFLYNTVSLISFA